jgi:phosphoglycolate phosphatase-like HAD superfamily hydrolase
MKLALFDIDGTLLDADEANEAATISFIDSFHEDFGITHIDTRWETYRHATEAGNFEEFFERALSRKPSESETRRYIARQTTLSEELHSRNPGMFVEIKGASAILTFLGSHPDWHIGIATGCRKESALFKLQSIGIECEDFPLATSSDAISREEVLRICIQKSKDYYGVGEFEKIVSVGDAVWDLKTAANLKLGFVGINKPEKFKGHKDCRVLQDFNDRELFMQYLEEALVPRIA